MLTIGQVAQLAGTTVRAVRHYHQTGLLPEPPRGPNGYRRYRASDLGRLHQIRQLSGLGLALADIRELVDGSASDRRAALETLHDAYAEQERRLAERRVRIMELLAVEGDPAIPTRFRNSVKSFQTNGAPEDLMAVDAEIFRLWGGLIPPDQQRELEKAMAEMTDDPAIVGSITSYMRQLDEVRMLASDHPDLDVLARDFARFLRTQLPRPALTDDPGTSPDVEWLIQDLLSERLTPAQLVVMRGVISHLRASDGAPVARSEPTPPS